MAKDNNPRSYDQVMNASFERYIKTEDNTMYTNMYYEPTTSWAGNTDSYSYIQQNQAIPNSNQWSGSDVGYRPMYNTPDDEVSYFSASNAGSVLNYHDDNRCSSTDTTFSSSSQLSVFSQNSSCELYNQREDMLESQTDRKRKHSENEARQSKKQRYSPTDTQYRRWPKPPYTYNGIIATVIYNSENKALKLSGILTAMMELFPFFRGSYTGWRDSVRNILSKTPCFVKYPINLWTVDVTKLTAGMFLRQENRVSESGQFKATIHEHFNLPPIHIPDNAYQGKQRRKNAHSKEKYKLSTSVPKSNHNRTETDSKIELNVSLPRLDDCVTQTESPFSTYAYKRQEFPYNEAAAVPKMEPVSDDQQYTSMSSDETHYPYPASLYDVRKFVESEPRSSLDAVEHLSSLCFSEQNEETNSASLSEIPQIPSYRDSDAQFPQCSNTKFYPEPCTTDSNERNSNFSISVLVSTSTVSESVSDRTVMVSCCADSRVFETL